MTLPLKIIILCCLTLGPLAGCSVNQHGFPSASVVSSPPQETPWGRREQLKAYGVHLHTTPDWGIHFGIWEHESIYPAIQTADPSAPVQNPVPQPLPSPPADHNAVYAPEAMMSDVKKSGMGLSIGPHAFHAVFGISRRRMVRVRKDQSFVFYHTTHSSPHFYSILESRPQAKEEK